MTKVNNKAAVAGLLQKRMAETYRKGNSIPPLELGTIDGGMNLLIDGLDGSIPNYMVCRSLTLGSVTDTLTNTEKYGEHGHEIRVPEKMRSLKPGDRVLIAWASGTPVVIDIVQDKG